MRVKKKAVAPPVYCLDSFVRKETAHSFYIETLQTHLKNNPFVSKPHRHDFYLVLHITKGRGQHTIDFVDYPVEPNTFFLMSPGQVHSWKLSPDCEGYIFFFEPVFYQMEQSEKRLHEFSFFKVVQPVPYIRLGKIKEPIIELIIKEMLREYSKEGDKNFTLLRSYLDVILLKLAHYAPHEKTGQTENSTYKLRLLEQLIDKNFLTHKQPREYADLMHVSSSYLNTMCRQYLNKTLSDLISERVMLEAKRYFAFSNLTVNEVADHLNFSEPSYFIRYFRKHEGVTPEQFREQLKSAI